MEADNTTPRQFDFVVIGLIIILLIGIGGFIALNQDEESDSHNKEHPRPTYAIVYLAPFDRGPSNLFIADLVTGETRQLTNQSNLIFDYAISPNGDWIAYTASHEDTTATDIWLLHLYNDQVIQLTNCADANATCSQPAWNSDGSIIAYSRLEYGAGFTDETNEHIWLIEVATRESQLLFNELNVVGNTPQWSPTKPQIAFLLRNERQLIIYDIESKEVIPLENIANISGFFSADGDFFVYPKQSIIGNKFYIHLSMLDLETLTTIPLSGADENPVEDSQIAFHPTEPFAAIARRYLSDLGGQIYLLDLATQETVPLVGNSNYAYSQPSWSSDGKWLLMQRYPFDGIFNTNNDTDGSNDVTEIWAYEFETGELKQVVNNAFFPTFVPSPR